MLVISKGILIDFILSIDFRVVCLVSRSDGETGGVCDSKCWTNQMHNAHYYSWFYHTWLSHIDGLPCPSADSLDPMDWYCTFDVSKLIPKITCLLLYMTFNPILVCTCNFLPQTHLHRDVCISPNVFGDFLIGFWITWLLAFRIPWERSDSTLHYPLGVLYKEPLGYIEERNWRASKL